MRSTPELLAVTRIHIVLLASIVVCASLAAEAQQDSPAAVPTLSGYDSDTRQSIELACISQKMAGPAAYTACLNQQIVSLQGSRGIPNLNGYDSDTRQSMELACISQKTKGPAPYAVCLSQQVASLRGSPGLSAPKVSGGSSEAQQMMPSAAPSGATSSRMPNRGVMAAERPVNAMSKFTTEKIMKVHQGISSEKILEMFGAPKNISQGVCGASVGKPWTCTTWEYGEIPYEWATFTFFGNNSSLQLNNFDVHRN